MTFLYTAKEAFDSTYSAQTYLDWEKYTEWAELTHLTELVSLDGMLNISLVEPDLNNSLDWDSIFKHNERLTDYYTNLAYVIKRMKPKPKFNLLTLAFEPDQACNNLSIESYEFVGYELLDNDFCNSVLTNCGGFPETFLPHELNDKGLIDDFNKAYDIKKRILENNPTHPHADTFVFAVWRHSTIGRNYQNL